jgi:RimJ/RimL family protein N-acetyltransferase
MANTIVRRLVPSDAPLHRALMLEAYALSPAAFTSSVAEREALPIQWWAARMADTPNAPELVYGAFIEQELVGAAGLSIEQRERTSHKATLFGMYVRESVRGQGVGWRLVEEILSFAQRSGRLEVVQLTVSESNQGAIALYTRCGFKPFGTEPMAVKLGSEYFSKVHMWQPVAERAP